MGIHLPAKYKLTPRHWSRALFQAEDAARTRASVVGVSFDQGSR
jgi:hypothetical protein